MRFSWDDRKNRDNRRKHGIWFQDAVGIFAGPTFERVDGRFDYGELRIYAIGLANGTEVTLIYTDRDDDERRIVSAWRSESHERRAYWAWLES